MRLTAHWRLLGVLSLAGIMATPGRCAVDGHEECDRKIAALETRVAQLEAMVEKLAAKQGLNAEAAGVAVASAPPAPTPVAAPVEKSFEMPPELVPQIGKIGAEVGVVISGAGSPYHLNSGSFGGGFIDLPLFDRPAWIHGKISYEILVGLARSSTQMTTTSNVAQVSNLAVLTALNPGQPLQNLTAALNGTGAAPFPVKTNVETQMSLLEVVPFSFKYTTNLFDRWRLRPYAVLGWGTYVTIHDQNPARGAAPSYGVRPNADLPPAILQTLTQEFGGTSPFGAPLVAGQIGQSPELEALGLPSGHGNIAFGLHSGAGVELRLSRSFSLGFDAEFNRIAGAPGLLTTYGTKLGFHF